MSAENLPAARPPKPPLEVGGRMAAIVPQDADQAYRMARMICDAGMAPKGMEDPRKAVGAIIAGMEIGLTPLSALQSIAMVNGRPALWGDGMMALVRGSGLLEWCVEDIEGDGDKMVAVCTVKRAGEPREQSRKFSAANAKAAGLWNKQGPWTQYPQRMLQMRARSWALRDVFADVLRGVSSAEEMRDVTPMAASPIPARPVTAAAIIEQTRAVPADPAPETAGADQAPSIPPGEDGAPTPSDPPPPADEAESLFPPDEQQPAPRAYPLLDGDDAIVEHPTSDAWLAEIERQVGPIRTGATLTRWESRQRQCLASVRGHDPEAAMEAVALVHDRRQAMEGA